MSIKKALENIAKKKPKSWGEFFGITKPGYVDHFYIRYCIKCEQYAILDNPVVGEAPVDCGNECTWLFNDPYIKNKKNESSNSI